MSLTKRIKNMEYGLGQHLYGPIIFWGSFCKSYKLSGNMFLNLIEQELLATIKNLKILDCQRIPYWRNSGTAALI